MKLPEFKDITAASGQVATQSAMNPILWVTVICTPILAICSTVALSPLSYLLLAMAALPLLACCGVYTYFAIVDADRLQSEPHREKMARSRIGDNRTKQQTTLPAGLTVSNTGDDQ